MTAQTFWRHLRRDARGSGGRLLFFVACLAIGVGAVVSVSSFSTGLDRGIRAEARSMLAADLAIRSRAPIAEELHREIDKVAGSQRTDVLEMLTVVALPEAARGGEQGRSLLVELKAIGGEYPFYGNLELEPPAALAELLDERSVVVSPEVTRRMAIEPGDTLRIGGEDFVIAAWVHQEPDRIAGAFSMGPRVFVSRQGLTRAGLEQYGSRIQYRTLVRLPELDEATLAALAERLSNTLRGDSRHRIETYRQAQPALREGLRRMQDYIGLAALLSLLIGGIGVAQTVRTWLTSRMDAIAVLKCLGYRPREVLALYLGQTAFLGFISSLLGVVLGVGLQVVTMEILRDVLPVEKLSMWQPVSWLQGLLLGVAAAILASIPPLTAASRVPPIRVLRRSAEPVPASRSVRILTTLTLLFGVFGAAWWQSRSPLKGALFVAGLTVVTLLLAGAAWLLMRFARLPRRGAGPALRQGLAALARPDASTIGAVVALGLGVTVLLAMFLVERGLGRQLDQDLPDQAPTAFLVDIQPDQWTGVRQILDHAEGSKIDSVPVVMARITSIDGKKTSDMVAELEEGGKDPENDGDVWALRREQRLTYLDELPADNIIVDGSLWSDPAVAEVSVEQEFADNLGVKVGTVLGFDIQGVQLEMKVTSLRTVDWSTFGINFFLVVEPGVLDDAPQFRIAAANLAEEDVQMVQDRLAATYPNVSFIQIREVLEKVSAIIGRLGLGVRLLGTLTLLAGLAILAGAISADAVRRGAEVALLKALGMTRRQVVTACACEYALVGAVAGLIGTLGGSLLAWAVLTQGMEIDWTASSWWFPGAVLATMLLAIGAGLAASLGPLRRRPIEVLRGESG